MAYADLTLQAKGEVKVESSYNGKIEVTVDGVDIDDVISEIGLGELIDHMDIDEVISELERKGYAVTDED